MNLSAKGSINIYQIKKEKIAISFPPNYHSKNIASNKYNTDHNIYNSV